MWRWYGSSAAYGWKWESWKFERSQLSFYGDPQIQNCRLLWATLHLFCMKIKCIKFSAFSLTMLLLSLWTQYMLCKIHIPMITLSLGEDKLPLERRWRKSEIVIQNKWRVTHKSLLFQINIASLRIAIATQLTEAFQTFITLIFNWFWCNLFKLSLSFLSFLKKKNWFALRA